MKQLVSVISYLEAFSALLLFSVAMPVKYIGGNPELVSIVGAIHGGLFVLFVGLLLFGVGKHWNRVAFLRICCCGHTNWAILIRRHVNQR